MSKFRRHISVGFEVSQRHCREEEKNVAGTGEGNKLSGNMH